MTSSTEYWQKIASNLAFRKHTWKTLDELRAALDGIEVASHANLIRLLPNLDKPAQIAAIRIFDILEVRCAGPALFERWLSNDSNISFAAGQALQSVCSKRAFRLLINHIWMEPLPSDAEQACYLLSHSGRWRCSDDILLVPLLDIYAADRIPYNIRAQAAEGIAYQLSHIDRRTKRYHKALPILLKGLRDITPEVRFWTCFALGHIRAKQALPILKQMVLDDDGKCPTWWTVKEEAAHAICHIRGVEPPEYGPRLGP